jgi:MFS family permease
MFSMLFYVQFYSLLPIFGREILALDQIQIALLFSISGVTVVLLQFPTSFFIGRIPKRSGYVLGVVLMAIGITGIALAPDFPSLLGMVVLMTLGENMFFPLAMAMVAEIAPEAERGMYIGAFALFLYVGGNLSPLLGGLTWDVSGNPMLPWLLSPVYAAVTVILALLLKPRRAQKPN